MHGLKNRKIPGHDIANIYMIIAISKLKRDQDFMKLVIFPELARYWVIMKPVAIIIGINLNLLLENITKC